MFKTEALINGVMTYLSSLEAVGSNRQVDGLEEAIIERSIREKDSKYM